MYDGGHIEEWLRRAKIPQDAVGTVLEAGETHDGPMTDLVEIAPIPDPRKTVDPLEVDRAFNVSNELTGKTVIQRVDLIQIRQKMILCLVFLLPKRSLHPAVIHLRVRLRRYMRTRMKTAITMLSTDSWGAE